MSLQRIDFRGIGDLRLPLIPYRPDLIPAKGTPEAIMNAAPDIRECYRAMRNEAIARAAQKRGEAWLTGAAVACLIGWRYQRAETVCAELEEKGWLIARFNGRGITEWKVRV